MHYRMNLATVMLAVTLGWAGGRLVPCHGMESRQDVFEFAARPTATKQADKWIITFSSKAACDATVAIVDKDGRIVRHLASGVLGRNAPPPFQPNSLAQRLEWDGLDDSGKPAPAGNRVKVSLGLTAELDQFFGWQPGGTLSGVRGLACDENSTLYVFSSGSGQIPTIRAFDKEGKYLRMLLPPPGNLAPERAALMGWNQTLWGPPAAVRERPGGGGSSVLPMGLTEGAQWLVLSAGPQGRLSLLAQFGIFGGEHKLVLLDAKDGAVLAKDIIELRRGQAKKALGYGLVYHAVSPDGQWAYFGGSEYRGPIASEKRPEPPMPPLQAVSRLSLTKRDGILERFVGDYDQAGKDDAHFDRPRGVACDAAGNVYVADRGNNRIQVFNPKGQLLKSMPLDAPERLAVDPKSGEVYATCAAGLVKLGGLSNPAVLATFALPPPPPAKKGAAVKPENPPMALDWASNPPAVWLATRKGLWRVEQREGKFENVLDATRRRPQGWEDLDTHRHVYITADNSREQLYVRLHDSCFPSPVLRLDGRTGKIIQRLDLRIEQIHFGPDRLAYMRLEDTGEWLTRYDPDADQFVPLAPAGAKIPESPQAVLGGPPQRVLASIWGTKKFDLAVRKPVLYRGQPIIGVFTPARSGGRTWQNIFGVAPNGDLYVPVAVLDEHVAKLKEAGLPWPRQPAGTQTHLLQVYSPTGALKSFSVLPGLRNSGAVRIGRRGEVYISLCCHPVGQELPEGLAAGGKYPFSAWGTLIKFDSAFDRFPVGTIAGGTAPYVGGWDEQPPAKPTHVAEHSLPLAISNTLWEYAGVSPLILKGCTCANSHFDLDGFDRCFVPAAQTHSITVLDANGNLVIRLGGYGNADNCGKPGPGQPEIGFIFPRFVAVTDEAVYVMDGDNERIVRARLGYQAEQEVALPPR